jgi:transport and Golgi organization protein 2
MCTVSIVPTHGTLRVVCNRDEHRSRPLALPPEPRTVGARAALFPIDPASGGTWIGVNDAHLAIVLLNRSQCGCGGELRDRESRGAIIPRLLRHDDLHDVVKAALALDTSKFAPFRLVAVHRTRVAVVTSANAATQLSYPISNRPLMLTSSSLGDRLVEGPRGALFNEMVVRSRCTWQCAQDRFHRHSWPHAPALSVTMNRPDARTVSRTVVEIGPRATTLHYESLTGTVESCLRS